MARKRRRNRSSPQAAGDDRLGSLPDEILHHILSFLPAQDAVRTCLLARRWRNLWKFATGLRIVSRHVDTPPYRDDTAWMQESAKAVTESVKVVREFMDNVLRLHGGWSLDTCQIYLHYIVDDGSEYLNRWIRHVLRCKVRVLSLEIGKVYGGLDLNLISDHLRKLQLSNVRFEDIFDLSCCSALEVLEIDRCDLISTDGIWSQSLKCLSISRSYLGVFSCVRIYAPNLHALSPSEEDPCA